MEEEKESGATGQFKGYSVPRDKKKAENIAQDSGMRMDTMGGDDPSSEGDYDPQNFRDSGDSDGDDKNHDKLSVNLDDLEDEPEDSDEAIDLGKKGGNDLSSLQYSQGSDSTNSGLKQSNLFAVGFSNDKGLADMETGSEVYMSELLVSYF